MRTSADWLALLHDIGAPAGPIRDVAAALEDAQVEARRMVQSAPHATAGAVRVVGPVAHYGRTQASVRAAPPVLGQHTDEVLGEWLGCSVGEIAALRQSDAIR